MKTAKPLPSPPHPDQYKVFNDFCETLKPGRRSLAAASLIGYVLGDIKPEVFESAMELLRRSFKDDIVATDLGATKE